MFILVDRSRDWIRQAERDLENAKYEFKGGYFEWACFLAQQASEKAVKAVFNRLGLEAFGHSVAGLLSKLPDEHRPGEDLICLLYTSPSPRDLSTSRMPSSA